MCSTRLGFADWDLDEAWTMSGRIASTPPLGAGQSMAATRAESL